jgi:hypothetical protein
MAAANILETFYFLFETDASGVRDGIEDAENAADRLEQKQEETEAAARKTETAVKDTGKAAAKTADSFAVMAMRAAAVLAPFAGLAGLKGAVSEFAANADAAGKLAESLNVDIEALQAWQGAAVRAGGSAEGMTSSMKSLDGKLREMRRGGGGEAGYALYSLGISARDAQGRMKSADVVLGDLSGKFAGLSRQRAMRMGEMLGLDEGTVELLRRGEKGVAELIARQKELGLYSKKDAEESRKFNNVMADMKQAFSAVSAVVMRLLMPVFTAVSEGITKAATAIRRHQNLVTGFFTALSVVMGVLAIKAGIAFAPFLAVAAVVLLAAAAFAVLYDDVQAFLSGHNSMIGKLSEDYPGLADTVLDLVDTFSRLWNIAKAVGELLVDSINDPAAAWEAFVDRIAPDVDALSEKFPELAAVIRDLGDIFLWLFDLAVPVLKSIFGVVKELLGYILDAIAAIGGWIGKAVHWAAGKIRGDEAPAQRRDDDHVGDDEAEYASNEGYTSPRGTGKAPEREGSVPPSAKEPAPSMPGKQPSDTAAAPVTAKAARPASDAPVVVMPEWEGLARPASAPPMPGRLPPHPAAGSATAKAAGPTSVAPVVVMPKREGLARPVSAPPMPGRLPPDIAANLAGAKAAIRRTDTPLSSLPPGAAGRRTEIHKSTSVKIDQVTVQTQAQDAEGISRDIGAALENKLRDLAEQYDDGVSS